MKSRRPCLTTCRNHFDDLYIKLWVGFLKEHQRDNLEVLEELNVDYWSDPDPHRQALPYAHALVEAAQEHFAFFSAAETVEEMGQQFGEADMANGRYESGLDGVPVTPTEERFMMLEQAVGKISQQLETMTGGPPAPKRWAIPKASSKSNAAVRPGASSFSTGADQLRASYPPAGSGSGGCSATAGVPHSNLADMQNGTKGHQLRGHCGGRAQEETQREGKAEEPAFCLPCGGLREKMNAAAPRKAPGAGTSTSRVNATAVFALHLANADAQRP